jgi:hypothetical protein
MFDFSEDLLDRSEVRAGRRQKHPMCVSYTDHLSCCLSLVELRTKHRQKSKGKAERNDRLFAVPRRSQAIRDVRDLSKPIQQELEKFFIATEVPSQSVLELILARSPA